MKPTRFIASLILCLGVSALASAQGGAVQRDTKLAVSEPTQVGPILLDPGSYTLRVHDFKGGKVQVTVVRDSDLKTMGTATAMRARRNLDTNQQADNQTQFTYTSYNGHPAVDTWYYPGDEWGEQFVYGKETIAANTGDVKVTQTPAPTASTSTMAESRPPAPAPAPVVEERREETKTAEVAPAREPAPAPEARTLPKTASSTPLVALLGALSLAGAAAIRFGSRKAA